MSRMIRLTEEELCAHVGDWYRDWKDKFGEETHPLGFAKEDLKHRLLGMIPVSFVVDKDFPGVPVLDGVWGGSGRGSGRGRGRGVGAPGCEQQAASRRTYLPGSRAAPAPT